METSFSSAHRVKDTSSLSDEGLPLFPARREIIFWCSWSWFIHRPTNAIFQTLVRDDASHSFVWFNLVVFSRKRDSNIVRSKQRGIFLTSSWLVTLLELPQPRGSRCSAKYTMAETGMWHIEFLYSCGVFVFVRLLHCTVSLWLYRECPTSAPNSGNPSPILLIFGLVGREVLQNRGKSKTGNDTPPILPPGSERWLITIL